MNISNFFISIVFPAPENPTIATNSLASIFIFTFVNLLQLFYFSLSLFVKYDLKLFAHLFYIFTYFLIKTLLLYL